MRDIYDPQPPTSSWDTPRTESIAYTKADVACLIGLCLAVLAASWWAWSIDETVGFGITVGGIFVILESWFSAMSFLHRHPSVRPVGRWVIVLAALIPWIIGLGFAAALMVGLFTVSDWLS